MHPYRHPFRAALTRSVAVLAVVACAAPVVLGDTPLSRAALIETAVRQLIAMQEEDGAWPYEGVYRVAGEIPIGYRAGGTAIVCETLLFAAGDDPQAGAALERGVGLIVKLLDDPLLAASRRDAYDVRVWAHAYVLQLFCRLKAADRCGPHRDAVRTWIPTLVATLITEQLDDGGWNYAGRRAHGTFVTGPVVQALLLARAQGEVVPDDVFAKAAAALRRSRYDSGAFAYSGSAARRPAASQATDATSQPTTGPARRARGDKDALPGSIARSAVCETTLRLLGEGSPTALRAAIDGFHAHWDELEARRRKTGTHEGPYGIAPYYFYYGHRYAAQAIEFLPVEERARARERLFEAMLRTRDNDGTWNDRVFPRSRNFGTAMIVQALLGEAQPLPPALGAR